MVEQERTEILARAAEAKDQARQLRLSSDDHEQATREDLAHETEARIVLEHRTANEDGRNAKTRA